MGALALIDGLREDHALVMNGDVLTDIDYGALLERHRASAPPGDDRHQGAPRARSRLESCASAEDGDPHPPDGLRREAVDRLHGQHGRLLFAPDAHRARRAGERPGLPRPHPALIAAGKLRAGVAEQDYWLDIGRHDDYEQALEEFESVRERLPPSPLRLAGITTIVWRKCERRRGTRAESHSSARSQRRSRAFSGASRRSEVRIARGRVR